MKTVFIIYIICGILGLGTQIFMNRTIKASKRNLEFELDSLNNHSNLSYYIVCGIGWAFELFNIVLLCIGASLV